MTIEENVCKIRSFMGQGWPKCTPIPKELIAPLCAALWEAGINPSTASIIRCMPELNVRAVRDGAVGWRMASGLPRKGPRWLHFPYQHPLELAPLLPSAIMTAPLTCLDAAQDRRWPVPSPRVLTYIAQLENRSVREVTMLFALLKAGLGETQMVGVISGFAAPLNVIMAEQKINDIRAVDPDDFLIRICEGEVGKALSQVQRFRFVQVWTRVSNALEAYADRLIAPQLKRMKPFLLRPLTKRSRMQRYRTSVILLEHGQNAVKAKAEVVHSQFYQLRFSAQVRLNQARRLYQAVRTAIAYVEANSIALPHRFSYEEAVTTEHGRKVRQRVNLTLWDVRSTWDHATALGHPIVPITACMRRLGQERFSLDRLRYLIQYRGVESLDAKTTPVPFWFLDLYENRVFSDSQKPDIVQIRTQFYKSQGYNSRGSWKNVPGLLKTQIGTASADWEYLQSQHGYRYIPFEGVYVASLIANLAIRVQTIAGARIGEVEQIAQNPECVKQLVNVGPKAATRWLLRLTPKGRKERANFYIDEDTKKLLVELVAVHREKYQSKTLPVVRLRNHDRFEADRYILQWDRKALDQAHLNSLIRFVLHGMFNGSGTGRAIHLTSHLLRHAFATEMASLKVPADVIARILHHRNLDVTRYYAQPTSAQVVEAAELMFIDRVDFQAEALRSPDEIGRMLKEAEGKIGALTEVIGGTCVIGNMCPVKFACVGCSGNAPDPDKSDQIQRKLAWATEQARWAEKAGLYAEQRQMKQLIGDCELMLQEMNLIKLSRQDASQVISVKQ